jgi:hypothetical protein
VYGTTNLQNIRGHGGDTRTTEQNSGTGPDQFQQSPNDTTQGAGMNNNQNTRDATDNEPVAQKWNPFNCVKGPLVEFRDIRDILPVQEKEKAKHEQPPQY